ncbi:MAG: 50S ribosomal protein L29 [Xanthomonadales bacterium]|nr:50S ribosomal protein L29 [Xanthomonadales bacterium]
MNAQDLKAKSQKELREQLSGLLREQFSLRMQKGTGQLTKPHELRRVRRDIARVNTILNEKSKEGTAA